MSKKDCVGYRIFLGIILLIVVGVAVWYGILSYGQQADLKDATLVWKMQEEIEGGEREGTDLYQTRTAEDNQ